MSSNSIYNPAGAMVFINQQWINFEISIGLQAFQLVVFNVIFVKIWLEFRTLFIWNIKAILLSFEFLLISHLAFSLVSYFTSTDIFDTGEYKVRLAFQQINRALSLILFIYFLFVMKRIETQLNQVKY